jgi:biopolymer transport protein ExbD
LIDVLLVLLIIFMIITPLTPKGLRAVAPQLAPAHPQVSETALVLELLGDGTLRLNTRLLTERGLNAEIARIFASRADKVLFIEADQELEYRAVVRIIDAVEGVDPSVEVGLMTAGVGGR